MIRRGWIKWKLVWNETSLRKKCVVFWFCVKLTTNNEYKIVFYIHCYKLLTTLLFRLPILSHSLLALIFSSWISCSFAVKGPVVAVFVSSSVSSNFHITLLKHRPVIRWDADERMTRGFHICPGYHNRAVGGRGFLCVAKASRSRSS